jgi:SAM-dependent methyltransferase
MAAEPRRPTFRDGIRTVGRGAEVTRIIRLLEPGPDDRLLDVGGRTGAFTSRFSSRLGEVTILEPDPAMARSGERSHPAYRFVTAKGEKIPFPDGSFDRITAIRSTHHMDSPEQFFQEAYRSLAEGGRILIEERAPGSGVAWLFRVIGSGRHHHPLDFRSSRDWEGGLASAGFVDVRATVDRRWFFVTGHKPPRGATATL